MGLDYPLFKKTMATIDSVGEDKEVELKIIKKGHTIEYVHDAIIYDEKTQESANFVNQRRRWIAAQLDYFKSNFFDGIAALVTKGNFDYFDKVIQMVQPPRILLTGILFFLSLLYGLIHFLPYPTLQQYFAPGFYYWLGLFVATSLALLFAIPRRFYNKHTFMALLSLPRGFILMFLSLLKVKGASKQFLHTDHSHPGEIKHN